MYLQAYDDEVVGLAMNALEELAVPPPQHRYHGEFNRHQTPLHKVATHSLPLFDIVDAACQTMGEVPLMDLLGVGPVQGVETAGAAVLVNLGDRAAGAARSCLVSGVAVVARGMKACCLPTTSTMRR